MRSVNNIIPQDKDDEEKAKALFQYTYNEVKPFIPELLGWLQDGHWPVSQTVGRYLASIAEHLTAELVAILQTNDAEWNTRLYAGLQKAGLFLRKFALNSFA